MAKELKKSEREITLELDGKVSRVCFNARSIQEVTAALPSVEAIYDCPPNQWPAGGSAYILVIKEGSTLQYPPAEIWKELWDGKKPNMSMFSSASTESPSYSYP